MHYIAHCRCPIPGFPMANAQEVASLVLHFPDTAKSVPKFLREKGKRKKSESVSVTFRNYIRLCKKY